MSTIGHVPAIPRKGRCKLVLRRMCPTSTPFIHLSILPLPPNSEKPRGGFPAPMKPHVLAAAAVYVTANVRSHRAPKYLFRPYRFNVVTLPQNTYAELIPEKKKTVAA